MGMIDMKSSSKIGVSALAKRIDADECGLFIQFGGMATSYYDELKSAWMAYPYARDLIDRVCDVLAAESNGDAFASTDYYKHGIDVRRWFEAEAPSEKYLLSSCIAQPLLFMMQMANLLILMKNGGYTWDFLMRNLKGVTGHSQGITPAILLSVGLDDDSIVKSACDIAVWLLWRGLRMQEAYPIAAISDAVLARVSKFDDAKNISPMAAIGGIESEEISSMLDIFNFELPDRKRVYISLKNAWNRSVISGDVESIVLFREVLERKKEDYNKNGGAEFDYRWEYLNVTAPFHCPYQMRSMERFFEDTKRLGIRFDSKDLKIPVFSTSDGSNLQNCKDLTKTLIENDFCSGVDWPRTIKNASSENGVTHIIDMGSGDTTAKLTSISRHGDGISVISFSTPDGKRELFTADESKISKGICWSDYAPKLKRLNSVGQFEKSNRGRYVVDNGYTRFTKSWPIFGGGMTPTTVEPDIVVAAANAGFIVELAGGGQVTESIFRQRMDELSKSLKPGRGIIINTMWLDAYLWNLHYPLILTMKREGYPIIGVTISAGIPEKDKAREILHAFNDAGIWCNAFKPGTSEQIKKVLEIADDNSNFTILMHVEGGKAGGHHSWSDLRKMILENYSSIRKRGNVILCVGGGIWNKKQANEWLFGDWHKIDTMPMMPVDAVFLGTRLTACVEAKTSPSVKDLIVKTKGTDNWVKRGAFTDGITSGISSLGADIHYIDNHASRFAVFLEKISKSDEIDILRRKSEIVAGLNKSAKPYFGDLEDMTYAAVLLRMVELMAPGDFDSHMPHDGCWYDVSFRKRFFAFAERTESRFSDGEKKLLNDNKQLDAPVDFIKKLTVAYPEINETTLHPEDVDYFIYLCKRPGKPVNFVPVIDGNIKKWFNSDSLWQSSDSRFDADSVFIIPGPQSIQGVTKVDEPVAEIFQDFSSHIIDSLLETTDSNHIEFAAYLGEEDLGLPSDMNYILSSSISSMFILDSGKISENFMRRWFFESDEKGRTFKRKKDGSIYSVSHTDGWKIAVEDGTIAASLEFTLPNGERHELKLGLLYRNQESMTPFELIANKKNKAICDFYKKIWKAKSTRISNFTTMVSNDEVSKYASSTGDTGRYLRNADGARSAVPINQIFSACWPAISASLFTAVDNINVLRLVHLSNEFNDIEGTILSGDKLYIKSNFPIVTEDEHGTTVSVGFSIKSSSGGRLKLTSSFYIRSEFKKKLSLNADRSDDSSVNEIDVPVVSLDVPRNVLSVSAFTPNTAKFFAKASGDFNPIHLDAKFAKMAGFDEPIMHGMWLSGFVLAKVVERVLNSDYGRLKNFSMQFIKPLPLGTKFSVDVTHVANVGGFARHKLNVTLLSGDVIANGVFESSRPSTAYVFTGQGSQRKGMGMDGYMRSRASKRVWNDADDFCKNEFGFSILKIVRDNPKKLRVKGHELYHPKGVLNLTQFTQVALVVLAMANVAELKEKGIYIPDAVVAGHSLGEYAALAIEGIVSLNEVVKIVYHRGLTMQNYVPRDENGNSPYRMIAVRPNMAGLSHDDLMSAVESIAEKNFGHLEVVNFNIKNEQYAVTGEIAALNELKKYLDECESQVGVKKKSYIDLEGIDVPFHSSVLRPGVDVFRKTLEDTILKDFNFTYLENRYIPNLSGRPFELSWDYIEDIYSITESPVLGAMLDHRGKKITPAFARTLLIEILAYQFASPVQWIKTQNVLINDLALEKIIEIGPAPVLVGMAKRTIKNLSVRISYPQVMHVATDRISVFEEYQDEEEKVTSTSDAIVVSQGGEETISPDHDDVEKIHFDTHNSSVNLNELHAGIFDALKVLLAIKTKRTIHAIEDDSNIEALTGGNSAKRNEIIADIGAEFGIAQMDNAHNMKLSELSSKIEQASRYSPPGSFLRLAIDKSIKEFLPMSLQDIAAYFKSQWGLDDLAVQSVLVSLPVFCRNGDSVDGEELSDIGIKSRISNRDEALSWLDNLVEQYGNYKGIHLSKLELKSASSTTKVDAAALDEFEKRYFGIDSAISKSAYSMLKACGIEVYKTITEEDADIVRDREMLAMYRSELGDAFERVSRSKFDMAKLVSFRSAIQWLKRDLTEIYNKSLNGEDIDNDTWRMLEYRSIRSSSNTSIRSMIKYFASHFTTKNITDNIWKNLELKIENSKLNDGFIADWHKTLIKQLSKKRDGTPWITLNSEMPSNGVFKSMVNFFDGGNSLQGKTVLITGAGPDSIGEGILKNVVMLGGRAIVTTSNLTEERLRGYRKIFQDFSIMGSEMYLLPASQGSRRDIDALMDWCFDMDYVPDIIIPFAAYAKKIPISMLGSSNWISDMRVMLEGVERLITGFAGRLAETGSNEKVFAVIPLSPNHGTFGGDGIYGETKLALEALIHKKFSEYDFWGKNASILGVSIGWTKGTGLMRAKDKIAEKLEDAYSIKTFTSDEMAFLITSLCNNDIVQFADKNKTTVNIHGGLDDIGDIHKALAEIGGDVGEKNNLDADMTKMDRKANPKWFGFPKACLERPDAFNRVVRDVDDMIVVVGMGEVSPFGSHRTRWDYEKNGRLSLESCIELAWMMGLIRYELKDDYVGWVDAKNNETISDDEIQNKYEMEIIKNCGVRDEDGEELGFDPFDTLVFSSVVLDEDSYFPVSSIEEGRSFVKRNDGFAEIVKKGESLAVHLKKGAVIKVPKSVRLNRYVAGQVPKGWKASRYGMSGDLIEQADRNTVFSMISAAEAFLSAGIEPSELYDFIHPSRVGNTQGSGLGGMQACSNLYHAHREDADIKGDALQEILVNVMGSWVNQAYVGAYGPVIPTVAACATAVVSMAAGFDLIKCGKADFVVAGASDDLSEEGTIGFGNMGATADSDEMYGMGISARAMSRPNDSRRKGFIEGQGGGVLLLTKLSKAVEMGLPIYSVLAFTSTHADGIQTSIPAPGMGLSNIAEKSASLDGDLSPVVAALSKFGLTYDDVQVISKHDTSTKLNDANENALHQKIAELSGRTDGNPILVHSQKCILGHGKGGAAAWQTNAAIQILLDSIVSGNINLDDVDSEFEKYNFMTFTDRSIKIHNPSAVITTSLGFGHVGGASLFIHPKYALSSLSKKAWSEYHSKLLKRNRTAMNLGWQNMLGKKHIFRMEGKS